MWDHGHSNSIRRGRIHLQSWIINLRQWKRPTGDALQEGASNRLIVLGTALNIIEHAGIRYRITDRLLTI